MLIKRSRFIAVIVALVMMMNVPAGAYVFYDTSKETPQSFNSFLYDCTITERIQMLQALKDLPGLKDKYFGWLKGLPPLDTFTDKSRKPSSFNEVPPETVIDAMSKGIIDPEDLSPSAVRKALIWRAYNKTTYYFRNDSKVDYHGIVQWAAEKAGIPDEEIKGLPTFQLENKIAGKYFEVIWDKLTHEQRAEILKNIEKESGINFDVISISAMGGAAALGALQATIIAYGLPTIGGTIGYWAVLLLFGEGWFIEYVLASLGYIAGWLTGVFWSPVSWIVAGPIGLTATAAIFAGGVFMMGSAEKETVSTFIMTVGLIKAKKYAK